MKYEKTGMLFEQREQNNPLKSFVFIEEVGKLINLTTVARLDDGNKDGYQRLIKCAKVKSIAKFMKTDEKNIIPNTITIAIGTELNCNTTASTIEFEYDDSEPVFLQDLMECKKSNVNTDGLKIENKALIIDGQHRLYGIYKNNPKDKVIVTAIINPELADQAFQYIVINQKAQSASVVDVKSVINSDEYIDSLSDRLIAVGITYGKTATILDYFHRNENSPFKDIIYWQLTEDKTRRVVPHVALEQMYRYCNLSIKGITEETQLLDFISTIWSRIKETFLETWNMTIEDKHSSNILNKASLMAITEFIVKESKVTARQNNKQIHEFTEAEMFAVVDNSIGKLPPEFFTSKWIGGLDNSGGREIIKSSIDTVIENISFESNWDENVQLLTVK